MPGINGVPGEKGESGRKGLPGDDGVPGTMVRQSYRCNDKCLVFPSLSYAILWRV